MLINYLKIITRTFRRERFHSIINLFGLTTGLTAFILIGLFVRRELSFDQFHTNSGSLYRVIQLNTETGKQKGFTVPDLATLIKDELPVVTGFSRLTNDKQRNLVQADERRLYTDGFYYTDQDFFELFDFRLDEGRKAGVLNKPGQAVVTRSFARKLFGEADPVGQEILLNKEKTLVVSGVCADPPVNSSIQFEVMARASENQFANTINEGYLRSVVTFLKLQEGTDIRALEGLINTSAALEGYEYFFKNLGFRLIPLADQHLRSDLDRDAFAVSDMTMIYLFSGIGLIILALAVINYVNMVLARSVRNGKQIGLRKVIGAQRRHLIASQLTESVLVTTLSLVMAFAMAERLIPLLNTQFGLSLKLNYLSTDFLLVVPLAGLVLGLISGIFPAMEISRKRPLDLIKNNGQGTGGRRIIRKMLVGFQFVVAAVMILVTVIMQSQMSFIKNREIGFEKELLIHIPLFNELKGSSQVFKNEILELPAVSSATVNNWMIGRHTTTARYSKPVDQEVTERPPYVENTLITGDKDIIQTLGIKVIEIAPGFELDMLDMDHTIVSQSVIEELGWQGDALGKYLFDYSGNRKKIVAIVEDFHSTSYRDLLEPTVIELGDASTDEHLLVRFASMEHKPALAAIGERYEEILQRPFEFSYMDDELDKFYIKEAGQVSLFNAFASLAVLLSLLGLVAMASYTTRQRQKEVSIRKVLGASARELIVMLNKEQTWLTVVAFAIATPISVYAVQSWLENFEYRITIAPAYFVLAVFGFLLLNAFTTLAYTMKVSSANPADTLRNE